MTATDYTNRVTSRWEPYVLPCGHTCAQHEQAREGSGVMPCDARQQQKPSEPKQAEK